jgi:cytochrome c oxidase subunit 4
MSHSETEPTHATHAVPLRLLVGVYAALLVLTVLTVAVTRVDLGPLNIWMALFIAVIKGGLVALYFMHLRWDSPFNGMILIAALLFVAIFIGIAVLDSREYQVNYEWPSRATATQ